MEAIVLFLLICVLIVFAVTFAVPARMFGFYVAWLAMLAMTFELLPSGPDHSSPFSGTGDAFYTFLARCSLPHVSPKASSSRFAANLRSLG
jgi:hypothetical protein